MCLLSDTKIPGQHQLDLSEVQSYAEVNLANTETLILSKVRSYSEWMPAFSCQNVIK